MLRKKTHYEIMKKVVETLNYKIITKEEFVKNKYTINYGDWDKITFFKKYTKGDKLIIFCSKFKLEFAFPILLNNNEVNQSNKDISLFSIIKNNNVRILYGEESIINFQSDSFTKFHFDLVKEKYNYNLNVRTPKNTFIFFRDNYLLLNRKIIEMLLPYTCKNSFINFEFGNIEITKNGKTRSTPIKILQINEYGLLKKVQVDCTRDEFVLNVKETTLLSKNIVVKTYMNNKEYLAKKVLTEVMFNDGTSLNTEDLLIINTNEDDVVKSYMIEDKAYYNVQKRQKNYDVNQVLSR